MTLSVLKLDSSSQSSLGTTMAKALSIFANIICSLLNGRRFFFCRFSFIQKLGYNITMKKTILFFIALGSILTILQFSISALVDPDGYYHIKAAQIIQEKGVSGLAVFPYLTKSVWQIHNADLSLGFHLILIAFISLFGGLIGIKILSIISGLLVFIVFW